jgi:hypothetical protein
LYYKYTTKRSAFLLFTAHATDRKPGERVTDQYRREQIAFPNQSRYYKEPRSARHIPAREQLEAAARRQSQYEAAIEEADQSYSGHSAGIHPEHRPSITDERKPRTRANTRVSVVADDNELEEDDEYYTTRSHSSARRYQRMPDVITRQGKVNVVEHYHEQPLRTHRQQLPPPRQREGITDEVEDIQLQPQRRFHPLVWIGTFCIFLILGWFGLNAVTTWYQGVQNDWTYGKERHFEINAVVGHSDSATNPSHFTAENNNGQIMVIELPGNHVSKAKIYQIETVPGNVGNPPVKISFQDLNGDGKLDMLVQIGDGSAKLYVTLFNNGSEFVSKL